MAKLIFLKDNRYQNVYKVNVKISKFMYNIKKHFTPIDNKLYEDIQYNLMTIGQVFIHDSNDRLLEVIEKSSD